MRLGLSDMDSGYQIPGQDYQVWPEDIRYAAGQTRKRARNA